MQMRSVVLVKGIVSWSGKLGNSTTLPALGVICGGFGVENRRLPSGEVSEAVVSSTLDKEHH